MINKIKSNKYRVVSKKGKNLGEFKTEKEAEKKITTSGIFQT